ncbi:MAG: GTPase [archaeon]
MRVRYSFGSRHTGHISNIRKQRGKYPDVMRDVVRISDIVLEILDARFADEMRNAEVEADVLKRGKRLIYVLNKIDLVGASRENGKWKIESRKLAREMRPCVFVSATKGIGGRDLRARIKMEARRILASRKSAGWERLGEVERGEGAEWKRVHVGVIGYPNAGKSSVINMITKRGVARVGKQAGFTKGMQKIRMSENILVLDTPGVISGNRYSSESGSFAKDVKVGARTYSDVRDPEGAVAFLLSEEKQQVSGVRCQVSGSLIEKFYGIKVDGDVDKLIEELGKKKGFLGKGGVVDVDRTARLILRDWQEGRIVGRG